MTDSPMLALTGALLLLVVPGGALAHVLGLRGLWWLATAPMLSVAAIAVTGIVAAPLRVPYRWWEPVVVIAAVAIVVLVVRAARRRRLFRPRLGRWTPGELVAIIIVAGAAVVAGVIVGAGIGPWDHISQTYDGLFHLNAVAWIQSTGDASSFDLYRITHPGTTDNEFYPAAWHALVVSTVQLTGSTIPVATNAVWLAVQSVIWMPGIALLAAAIAPARRRYLAAALSSIAAVGLVGFPDLLLAWGTLYPTALAYSLLPLGLVMLMRIMSWVSTAPTSRRLPFPTLIVALFAIWAVASALSHPRSLFSYVVVALPLVAIEGGRAVARIWRRPEWRRRLLLSLGGIVVAVLGVIAVGALYVYRTFDVAQRPIADHLNGGPATATEGPLAALAQAVALAPPSPSGTGQLPASWALAALVLIGLVVAATIARTRWIVIAWVLVVALWVLAAGSNSDIAKILTGVWYKDKFRLFSILPVLQAPIIAMVGVRAWLLITGRLRTLSAAVAVILIGAASATSNAVTSGPTMIGAVFALPAHDKHGLLINRDEQQLLEQLPRLVPAGAVVAGDPWDGSALSWAIGDRQALFPHVAGAWTPDELLVASALDQVRTNAAVCSAVKRLGIQWVVEDPQLLWNQPIDAVPFAGFHRAVQAGVLIPVAHVGSAGLYRIPACTG